MKAKIAMAVLCLLAFTVATAYGDTVMITADNYAALGWTKTLVTGPESGQSVNFDLRAETSPPGVEEIVCNPKKSQSGSLAWAGLNTQLFDNRLLSTVTHFRIRTCGFEGDGASWEPPAIFLGATKEGSNPRHLRAMPYYSFGRGTSWMYDVYDLLQCDWMCIVQGNPIKSWSDWMTTYPSMQFATADQCVTQLPSGQNFNVFNGCAENIEIKWGSSARGAVDWVEIGFDNGEFYMWDFDLPDYMLNNAAAGGSAVGLAKSKTRFVVFGRVVTDPAPGTDYFYMDDGAGTQVRVNAAGLGMSGTPYVRAAGYLNNTALPPELSCSAFDVITLYP